MHNATSLYYIAYLNYSNLLYTNYNFNFNNINYITLFILSIDINFLFR